MGARYVVMSGHCLEWNTGNVTNDHGNKGGKLTSILPTDKAHGRVGGHSRQDYTCCRSAWCVGPGHLLFFLSVKGGAAWPLGTTPAV